MFSCFVRWQGHRATSRYFGLRFLLPMTHCNFPAPMGDSSLQIQSTWFSDRQVLGCFRCRCHQRRGVYPFPFLRLRWYLCLFLQLCRRCHRLPRSPFEISVMPLSFRTCGGGFVDLVTLALGCGAPWIIPRWGIDNGNCSFTSRASLSI